MKANNRQQVKKLLDIPNIGPAMVRDFLALKITTPQDIQGKDPYDLYLKLCKVTNKRQDPCVLDTFIAVVDFMNGAPAKPWYAYSKQRKITYKERFAISE